MPITVRARTRVHLRAHNHTRTQAPPVCHTATTTGTSASSTQPAGKMEGAISLHFLHFSFGARGGSSRAAKSFHYPARQLDSDNKLDWSGTDEKRSDRTNERKEERQIPTSGSGGGAASNQNAAFQMIRRAREGGWIFWLDATGVFSNNCLCQDSDGKTRQGEA